MSAPRRDGWRGPSPRFTERIHITLSPQQLDNVDQAARQRDVSRAQVVRDALTALLSGGAVDA